MNFAAFLEQQGYSRLDDSGVYARPGYASIAYSDGNETEERLAALVAGAQDRSVLSRELAQCCTDWPTRYHLGKERANLLRPFAARLNNAELLEIGAGCGAITRFLGECGAKVLALEGSLRRAAIARKRTGDLEKVLILADKFDQFQCGARFDVVTLIGVLEYASLFTEAKNPFHAMLERARSLLKPDGRLLLAIENQLGLKYLAGAPEDHTNEPMRGVEDRYAERGARTFGRKALGRLLREAGFTQQEWLAPWPDYKMPVSLLTEAGIKCPEFDAAALARQSVRRDLQLPLDAFFAPELAIGPVAENGLLLDLANSWLVVAGAGDGQNWTDAEETEKKLAFHYSTHDRQAAFCKETRFLETRDGIVLRYQPLGNPAQFAAESRLAHFWIPDTAPYKTGQSLAWHLAQTLGQANWSLEDLSGILRKYLDILREELARNGKQPALEDVNTLVPGSLFDLVPQNIILATDGSWHPIDQEWALKEDMPLGWLLFRAVHTAMGGIVQIGTHAHDMGRTLGEFFVCIFQLMGFAVNEDDMQGFSALEAAVQEDIAGISRPGATGAKAFRMDAPGPGMAFPQQETARPGNNADFPRCVQEEFARWQARMLATARLWQSMGAVAWPPASANTVQLGLCGKAASWLGHLGRHLGKQKAQLAAFLETLSATPLFDPEYYLHDPELRRAHIEPAHHYFWHGASEGRNPNPYFYSAWYLASYPEVAASGMNPLLHYILHGAAEGKNPNPYFDSLWYLERYLDAKTAGMNPLAHYILHGWTKHFWPNPCFDPEWYRHNVLSGQNHTEPLHHFLQQGSPANPNALFDSAWYLQSYSWVAKMGIHPFQHYLMRGLAEQTNPSPYFDSAWYLHQHPEAGQNGQTPLGHYLAHRKETNPNPYFDAAWYLEQYPDVAQAGLDPLLHYIAFGAGEYRDPSPRFSTLWYTKNYPDVKKLGINPLRHFLTVGCFENRRPIP